MDIKTDDIETISNDELRASINQKCNGVIDGIYCKNEGSNLLESRSFESFKPVWLCPICMTLLRMDHAGMGSNRFSIVIYEKKN